VTQKQEQHIAVTDTSVSAVDTLATAMGLSKQHIKQAMQKGALWLERDGSVRRLRRASRRLHVGDTLHFYYAEAILAQTPQPARLIADEGAYSIWCKPSGMTSQGSKWGDHCTIQRWAEQHLEPQRSAFIVHRLDRAASGLILLAHQKRVAAAFARLFRERAIEKHYSVIVHGHFPDTPEPLLVAAPLDERVARSLVSCRHYDAERGQSMLHVAIETGRKHQIRRHLSGLGFPVVGDRLYGSPVVDIDLQLKAKYLAFTCPISGEKRRYVLDEC